MSQSDEMLCFFKVIIGDQVTIVDRGARDKNSLLHLNNELPFAYELTCRDLVSNENTVGERCA